MKKQTQILLRVNSRKKVRRNIKKRVKSSSNRKISKTTNLILEGSINPKAVIHIYKLYVEENILKNVIQYNVDFTDFKKAVLEEIETPSSVQVIQGYINDTLQEFEANVSEDMHAIGTFSFLATSSNVVEFTLNKYAQLQSFGIILIYRVDIKEFQVLCMSKDEAKKYVDQFRLRTKASQAPSNESQSEAQIIEKITTRENLQQLINPSAAIHICCIPVFTPNGIEEVLPNVNYESLRVVQHHVDFEHFKGAVLDEIEHPSTEIEKLEYFKAIVYDLQGLVNENMASVGTFSHLACSPLVVRSTLTTYLDQQTFGIVVRCYVDKKEYDILCMPTDRWYDYLEHLGISTN